MLAPYGATADVSGEGAEQFVAGLTSARVSAQATAQGFVVRAKDVTTLTRALREAPRPTAKVRVAVQ
jgi:hypothetical protein